MTLFGSSSDEQCSVHQFLFDIPIRNRIKIIPYVAVCIAYLFILRGLGLEFHIFLLQYEFVYSKITVIKLFCYKLKTLLCVFFYIDKH
jgi:hypothetical protein